jgi:hypothetical protein
MYNTDLRYHTEKALCRASSDPAWIVKPIRYQDVVGSHCPSLRTIDKTNVSVS